MMMRADINFGLQLATTLSEAHTNYNTNSIRTQMLVEDIEM